MCTLAACHKLADTALDIIMDNVRLNSDLMMPQNLTAVGFSTAIYDQLNYNLVLMARVWDTFYMLPVS